MKNIYGRSEHTLHYEDYLCPARGGNPLAGGELFLRTPGSKYQ